MKRHITIGMDLGDRYHFAVVLDGAGNEIESRQLVNSKVSLNRFFKRYAEAKVAIEAGTHSPWISRFLQDLSCEVYIGNPRKLRLIWDSTDKSDERDARMLARVCRVDPKLLWPVVHRNVQSHDDLEIIKARDILVQSRTKLINHVRSVIKTRGERMPGCSAASFVKRAGEHVPESLRASLVPLIEMIGEITEKIKQLDREIREASKNRYPETQYLEQVSGVGSVTALAYVLTLEDPTRFSKSRMVGAYLGLTPRRDQSGTMDKRLRITKAGNRYLRKLLVGSSQYILGPFGPDSDLRRYGMAIAARGGRNAKKRAAVAVARKLSVLLHRLWQDQESYRPLYKLADTKIAA